MQVFDSALARLKCAKNLYLSHRFFYKIRQIHRIFDAFRQNPPILCRNQALSRRSFPAVPAPCSRRPQPGEKPRPLAALPHKKPGIYTKWMPGRTRLRPATLLVLVEALTSSDAGLALVNLLLEEGNNATLNGLWILSCRVHQSNVVCGD